MKHWCFSFLSFLLLSGDKNANSLPHGAQVDLEFLVKLKEMNSDLKVLLSVGGGEFQLEHLKSATIDQKKCVRWSPPSVRISFSVACSQVWSTASKSSLSTVWCLAFIWTAPTENIPTRTFCAVWHLCLLFFLRDLVLFWNILNLRLRILC